MHHSQRGRRSIHFTRLSRIEESSASVNEMIRAHPGKKRVVVMLIKQTPMQCRTPFHSLEDHHRQRWQSSEHADFIITSVGNETSFELSRMVLG
ncbi:hypothetical protein GW17_00008027 [Ensete ventricosum]|nr:hypothetical protein GW17_00008027 [Ensete ventricosum]